MGVAEILSEYRDELAGTVKLLFQPNEEGFEGRPSGAQAMIDDGALTNPAPSNLMQVIQSWFATAGLSPTHLSTCNSLAVILRLIAAGEGVALLPTAILAAEVEAPRLRILRTRPAIPRQPLFGAYLINALGPTVTAVMATAREVFGRSNLMID